jgi:hypothetical protein
MKLPARIIEQKRLLLLLLLLLGVGNLLTWGGHEWSGFPTGALHSSGTAFARDGTVLRFTGRVEFKGKHFNNGVKVEWNGKTNVMQEVGTADRGLLGDLKIYIEDSTSIGPWLLKDVELDSELSLERSYMQTKKAKLNFLPLRGEFSGRCYYLLYRKKVYCGSSKPSI